MRRYMMRIGRAFCERKPLFGTDYRREYRTGGEPDHAESLAATNEVCTMPVYRPLIGFDKQEIIEMCRKRLIPMRHLSSRLKTAVRFLWQSIRLPNRTLKYIKRSETKLEEKIDELMQTAIDTIEVILRRSRVVRILAERLCFTGKQFPAKVKTGLLSQSPSIHLHQFNYTIRF